MIDGHALVQSMGKPSGCATFGDYATMFLGRVMKHFDKYTQRVDIVFDRYLGESSIKRHTRYKRMGKGHPIRRIITDHNVPLPQSWDNFMAMSENKADIARYLSDTLQTEAEKLTDGRELVIGGGFKDILKSFSNKRDIPELAANHEQADTRIILHGLDAVKHGYERIIVMCKDTDVLLLLIYHLGRLNTEVWMVGGTSKAMKIYPVHDIVQSISEDIRQNILGFHALTGCDTTSSFTGIGKKTCWKKYVSCPDLLSGIGRDTHADKAEKFVCLIYGSDEEIVDGARYTLFVKAKKTLELLPPTSDALELHILRANYQARIWLNADVAIMDTITKPSDTNAWLDGPNGLEIIWKRLPTVPAACIELTSCGCKTKCKSIRCKCFKASLKCTPACGCDGIDCANAFDC